MRVTHIGSTPVEQPNAGDTYTTNSGGQRILTRTTNQWRLKVPSATLWNLGVRYTLRRSRANQTFGINLNNITDRDYLRGNRLLSERRAIYFTYSIASGDKRR